MSRSLLLPCLPMAVLAIIASGPSPASAASCESLATFRLPQTTITSARSVSAGTFQPPSGAAPLATGAAPLVSLSNLPGFCRVAATLAPTTDSAIAIEVWMPAAGWNHRFQGVGNGGFAGTISYGAMADALRLGNATAADAKLGAVTNALNPELGAFRGRGGKLILYHGFDDTRVAPQDSIDYFASVVAAGRREKTASRVSLKRRGSPVSSWSPGWATALAVPAPPALTV